MVTFGDVHQQMSGKNSNWLSDINQCIHYKEPDLDCTLGNFFLSNCWLLVFVFLQGSAVKNRVLNFCLSSLAQQSRIRDFKFYFAGLKNPGFQFPVFNPTWVQKPKKINFKPEKLNSWFTLTGPLYVFLA